MEILTKKTIDAFWRAQPFSYAPAIGKTGNKIVHAFIRTYDKTEVLVCDGNEVYSDKYLFTPAICDGKIVFGGCSHAGDWYLGVWNGKEVVRRVLGGRVNFIRSEISCDGNNRWFVFELRKGMNTEAFAGTFDSSDTAVLYKVSGKHNAYDPHIAQSNDGFVYIVYGSFIMGNYHILLSKITPCGKVLTLGERVSDRNGMCMYPSVCASKDGGVWFCFVGFTSYNRYEDSYLQHNDYKLRRTLFMHYPVVYYARYKDGSVYIPVDKKADLAAFKIGYVEQFKVEGACAAKYPVITESPDGTLSIVCTYNKTGPDCWFSCPQLVVFSLKESGWAEPFVLIEENLHEYFAAVYMENGKITITSQSDDRLKNGWLAREWQDETNPLSMFSFDINPDTYDAANVFLHRYTINPTPIDSMEEKPYAPIKRKDGRFIVWGQTHTHTNLSVCCKLHDQTMITNHRFYQDVLKSRYGTTADHAYNMWPLEIHLCHKTADYLYFKNEYVAFPAYEWTCGYSHEFIKKNKSTGHYNPLYLEEDGAMPYYTPFNENSSGYLLPGLWDGYRGRKIITVPHHPADNSFFITWKDHDDEMSPVVEIFQDFRGQHEQPDVYGSSYSIPKYAGEDSWVLKALKKGYRLGFIAGGDHLGQSRGGLEVTELTRTALYEAFMERRTYACSGAGADIEFTCNGNPLGSILKDKTARFEFKINTNSIIRDVQIVKNGDTIRSFMDRINDVSFSYSFEDVPSGNNDFYYIRGLLQNGEVFWTSPIWFRF